MTGKVAHVEDFITPDRQASQIADKYIVWQGMRRPWLNSIEEVRKYVFATDTSATTNSKTPWKNKTTLPKLCQTRDNLKANYTATMYPQRKNIIFEANEKDSNSKKKRDAIQNYMRWCVDHPSFRVELDKCIDDYLDTGNAIGTVEWIDERVQREDGTTQGGFVGPAIRRISPIDIVFNPVAESFASTPKIIRSLISLGELKEYLERLSNDQNREDYEKLWEYLKEIRTNARNYIGDWQYKNNLYEMDGFGSFQNYLQSDSAEILTFYGDLYDVNTDEFWKNHIITVVDRHKIISIKPNPSFFGTAPIYQVPWRARPDNLYGMGPLENLVGLQYRLDHIENARADILDWGLSPMTVVTGYVEDFDWYPGGTIFASEEGKVDVLQPDVNLLQANFDLERIPETIELMAGAPREAAGFRTPGEKTKYEVEQLQNAASRIFQAKIRQFEEQFLEPLLNAMLELARRNMSGVTSIKVFDDEFNISVFQDLSVEDITGVGRIKPVAARHFVEQAQLVQNLTSLANSNLFPLVQPHMKSIELAKMFETIFDMSQYGLIVPFGSLEEQAEGQKLAQVYQEQVLGATMTASGMGNDYDLPPTAPQMGM